MFSIPPTVNRKSLTTVGLSLLFALNLLGCGDSGRVTEPGRVLSGVDAAAPGGQDPLDPSHSSSGGSSGSSGTSTAHPQDPKGREPETVPNPITNIVAADAELIGPEGGSVKAGLFEIDIPAGALTTPVLISVLDYSGVKGRIECELLPHGLQFNKPVELTVKLPDGVDAGQLALYWIISSGLPTEFWAPMPTRVANEKNKIIAELTHFSTYAPGTADGKAGWQKFPGRGTDRIGQSGDNHRP